jgi:hypothetical protein
MDLDRLIENAVRGTMDSQNHQRTSGGGNCANTVKADLINAGGPELPHLGKNPTTGKGNTPTPGAWGPTLIASGCYQQVADPANYHPQPGDIAIAVGTVTSHISIYDGNTWDADIAKPNAVPNTQPNSAYAGAQVTYYKYVGPN